MGKVLPSESVFSRPQHSGYHSKANVAALAARSIEAYPGQRHRKLDTCSGARARVLASFIDRLGSMLATRGAAWSFAQRFALS